MTVNDHLIRAARSIWFDENEPEDIGVESGIVWALRRGYVGFCGYALVPAEGHPWSRAWPNDIDQADDLEYSRAAIRSFGQQVANGTAAEDAMIQTANEFPREDHYSLDNYLSVHGGVTYYNHPWVGFDTGHAWDIWPEEYDEHALCALYRERPPTYARHWTVDMVRGEARNLARQLANIPNSQRAGI